MLNTPKLSRVLDVDALKREINYSRMTGAITLKSNCSHCYETGIESWSEGKPVLCRCMKIDHHKLALQNEGKLKPTIQ